jgi:hypothetical protein
VVRRVTEETPRESGRLENLTRLLDRASKDPALLLARACVGDARRYASAGDLTSARSSVLAAEFVLKTASSPEAAEILGELGGPGPRPSAPRATDPPAPPSPPRLR